MMSTMDDLIREIRLLRQTLASATIIQGPWTEDEGSDTSFSTEDKTNAVYEIIRFMESEVEE